MRRVLVLAWGKDATAYIGRRLTLYNDPSVRWGGQSVGGVRIAAMSHLDGRLEIALTVTRGKRAPFTVDPLLDGPTPEAVAEFERRISEASTTAELDAVAADLKGCDLGRHRKHLLDCWSARQVAIKS